MDQDKAVDVKRSSNCWQLGMGEERNAHSSEIELKGNKAWPKGVPWRRNNPTLKSCSTVDVGLDFRT